MANPFVYAELHSNDVKKAKEFYSKLFGWKLSEVSMPDGIYTMIDVKREGARRKGHGGREGGRGHRLDERDHGSDGCDDRDVEAEEPAQVGLR